MIKNDDKNHFHNKKQQQQQPHDDYYLNLHDDLDALNDNILNKEKKWIFDKEIPTIFFQGFGQSQTQILDYSKHWYIIKKTKDYYDMNTIEVIRFPQLQSPETHNIICNYENRTRQKKNPIRHPFIHLGYQFATWTDNVYGYHFIPNAFCIPSPPPNDLKSYSFVNDDGGGFKKPITLQMNKIDFGQRNDVLYHKLKYKAMCRDEYLKKHNKTSIISINEQQQQQQEEEEDVYVDINIIKGKEKEEEEVEILLSSISSPPACILYGVGVGAVATFNAVATHKYQKIQLVILEGCFKNVHSAIRDQMGCILTSLSKMALSLLTSYNPGGLNPMNLVSKFPTEIPIAFICSRSDDLEVSFQHSIDLVIALRKAGHDKVHLLILQQSRRSLYTKDNYLDRKAYTIWLHALYRLYDLPYIPEYAILGESLLSAKDELSQKAWFDKENMIKKTKKQY